MLNKVELNVSNRKGERGAVLALTAICMVALVLALALCLDISHFYSVETEMQNAADASALAGASVLDSTSGGIVLARQMAVAAMNKYEFNHNSINFSESNLYFATDFTSLQAFIYSNSTCAAISALSTPANVERAGETKLVAKDVAFVGICMPAAANTSIVFSQVAGGSSVLIRGRAVAGNSPPLTGVCNSLAPMSLLDDTTVPNSTEFPPGSVLTLRNAPGDAYSPGNYGLTETCGSGGSNVRDALLGNCAGCLSIGDTIPPKTGVTAGPVRQGWNDRFDSDAVVTTNISYSQYQQQYRDYLATGTITSGINTSGNYGRRVIIVPAVNKDDVLACSGSGCTWHITDFMGFFIKDHVPGGNGGEITAEFIGRLPVAGGTFGGGGTPIPSLTKTVLYR
ncbi:MAG: pilus assembly protein TadG-related protein [bacterium]